MGIFKKNDALDEATEGGRMRPEDLVAPKPARQEEAASGKDEADWVSLVPTLVCEVSFDHVSGHRTIAQVISPYTQTGAVDSTLYSTVSMLHTMELILGLPPLSQYDAAARPMFACFTDKPDLTPYQHEPARTNVNAVNAKTAYGAERSSKMDFSDYDRVDDFELNEILWRSIKGKNAPLPPAVRRAIAFRSQR